MGSLIDSGLTRAMRPRQLRIAIIGGGIGGVATALAFHRRDVETRCFEQADLLSEVGAGLMLAPNGVRVLEYLGLGDALDRVGSRVNQFVNSKTDGTPVGDLVHSAAGAAPSMHFGIHRADLLELLSKELPDNVIVPGHRCVGFQQNSHSAIVHFSNGASYEADAVIAADGIHSFLQGFVVPPARPIHSGTIAYRGILPNENVGWPAGRFQLWMGPGKHFVAYPVRGGQLLNYVGFITTTEQKKESWSASGDPRELAAAFAGWDEVIIRMINQINRTFAWGLYDREPLVKWTSGRLGLLGDAAHPMLPHAGQGANQTLEDAITIATLLSRGDPASVTISLERYAQLRQSRTSRLQLGSRRNGSYFDSDSNDGVENSQPASAKEDESTWIHDHDAVSIAEEEAQSLPG